MPKVRGERCGSKRLVGLRSIFGSKLMVFSEESWVDFLGRFALAISHLIPDPFSSVKLEGVAVETNDLDALRDQVHALSDIVSTLFPTFHPRILKLVLDSIFTE